MSGARIGIPTKLMPNTHFSAGIGKWSSARGEYSAESFRIVAPGTTLPAVFERMKKEPAGRKADYSLLRGDFFVISGLRGRRVLERAGWISALDCWWAVNAASPTR